MQSVVSPNLTGRTKERIAQSKRACAGSRALALLTSHTWRELVSSGRLVCRCHDVFLWCHLCFALLRFRHYAFVKAAALRSIVLRYIYISYRRPDSLTCFFLSFSFVYLEMSLFPSIFCTIIIIIAVFCLTMYGEYVVRSFLSDRGVFSTLPCDHGLDF